MKFVRHLEEILGSVLLLAVGGITLFNVASRYLFNQPLSWAEEAATYLFVWLVMLGAALALKEGQHFAVDVLVGRLPGRFGRNARRLGHLLVVAGCMVVLGAGLVYASWGLGTVTPAMEISRAWPYAAVPFGGALMCLRAVQRAREQWADGRPVAGGKEAAE